jgi:hypothetical protein
MKKLFYTTGICIALTFVACSSNKSEENASAAADTLTMSLNPASDLSDVKAKLVKTADIDFQVKDVRQSSNNIYRNVMKFSGLVMHNDIQTLQVDSKTIPVSDDSLQLISSYKTEAHMTVRLPSENLNDFAQSVATDATIIYNSKLDIDDRSIDYLSNTLKQHSRKKILDRELQKDTLKTDKLLQLANEQDNVIESRMNNLRTDESVRYSTISLHFAQNTFVKKEIVANSNLTVYQPPLFKRFANAMAWGFNFLLNIIIAFIHIWPLVIFGAATWFAFPYLQKRWKVKI